jgi:hypothetical protein
VASILLLIFFFGFLRRRFGKGKTLHPAGQNTLFVLVFHAGISFIGGLFVSLLNGAHATNSMKGTYFLYARYYEYMAVPLLFLGLYLLFTQALPTKKLVAIFSASAAIYLVFTVLMRLYLVGPIEAGSKKRFSILGVLPFTGNAFSRLQTDSNNYFDHYNVTVMAVVTLGVLGLLALLICRRRLLASLGVLCVCFLYVTFYALGTTLLPWSSKNHEENLLPYQYSAISLSYYDALYEAYPNLYYLSPQLIDPPYGVSAYGPQLSLNNYSVQTHLTLDKVLEMEDPATQLGNAILISHDYFDLTSAPPGFTLIHSDWNATIWIYGEEITASWAALTAEGP